MYNTNNYNSAHSSLQNSDTEDEFQDAQTYWPAASTIPPQQVPVELDSSTPSQRHSNPGDFSLANYNYHQRLTSGPRIPTIQKNEYGSSFSHPSRLIRIPVPHYHAVAQHLLVTLIAKQGIGQVDRSRRDRKSTLASIRNT